MSFMATLHRMQVTISRLWARSSSLTLAVSGGIAVIHLTLPKVQIPSKCLTTLCHLSPSRPRATFFVPLNISPHCGTIGLLIV